MIRKSTIWLLILILMFSSLVFANDDNKTEEDIPDLATLENAIDVNGISTVMINRGSLRFNIQFHDNYNMYMSLVQIVEKDEEIEAIEASINKAIEDGKSYDEINLIITDARKLVGNNVTTQNGEDSDVQPLNFLMNPTEYRLEVALTVLNYHESKDNVDIAYNELMGLKENTKNEPLSIIPTSIIEDKEKEQKIALAEIKYNAAQRKFFKDEKAYQKLFESVIINRVAIKSEGLLPYLYVSQPSVGVGMYKIYFEDDYSREFKSMNFEILDKDDYDKLQQEKAKVEN